MRKTILTFLSLIIGFGMYAQDYLVQVKSPAEDGWYYVDVANARLTEAAYTKCFDFSEEGIAIVIDEKKTLFLDAKGNVIQPKMQNITLLKSAGIFGGNAEFHDGLLAIKRSDRWGFMDTKGELVIQLKYTKASNFENGHAVVYKGEKYYVINKAGEETGIDMENVIKVQAFSDGLAPYYSKDKKWGFIGIDGKVAIPAQYKAVGYFNNGIAWARSKKGKYGFIDKKGAWVLEPIYDTAKDFDKASGMARVKLKGKWGYVNKKGDFLKVDTEKWGDFKDGLAKGRKNGLIGFYDNTGNWVVEPTLQGARDFKNGYCAAKKDDLWGLINKEGEWVIEPQYISIRDVSAVK